jgi:hypothetical protein
MAELHMALRCDPVEFWLWKTIQILWIRLWTACE